MLTISSPDCVSIRVFLYKENTMIKSNIMNHFNYEHLPQKLQDVSKPICELAKRMEKQLPHGAEKIAGLRKLLEAKDCFVRARTEAEND